MFSKSALVLLVTFIGAPLFTGILAIALLGFYSSDIDLTVVGLELLRIAQTPLLSALPFFAFAGFVLSESRASERLLALVQAAFGWLPAGLCLVALLLCAFFTAFTGASGVTIVAVGGLLLPALMKAGYRERFSLGLLTSSGSLGLLLPPSLPLILYGIIVQQMDGVEHFQLTDLFLAGLLPALVMILCLFLLCGREWAHARVGSTPFDSSVLRKALWAARWELPLPILVLWGIYGGVLVLSESAAFMAAYVVLVECFAYREITLRKLSGIAVESMTMVGGVLIILASALVLTNYLIDNEVPTMMFEFVKQYVSEKWVFLLCLNLFLLLLGMMLDIFSALVVVVPLIVPVAISYGIHPVHLGIVFLANMQIGYFTPPVGMNLFIASFRFKQPIMVLYHSTVPFMIALLIALALITWLPWLSLWHFE